MQWQNKIEGNYSGGSIHINTVGSTGYDHVIKDSITVDLLKMAEWMPWKQY